MVLRREAGLRLGSGWAQAGPSSIAAGMLRFVTQHKNKGEAKLSGRKLPSGIKAPKAQTSFRTKKLKSCVDFKI